MSFTLGLIRTCVTNVVPFGDRLPFMSEANSTPAPSRASERARLGTARRIQQAVREGRLDSSYGEKAKNMIAKVRQQRAERSYTSGSYMTDQLEKLAIADSLLPGAGAVIGNMVTERRLRDLQQYANQTSYTNQGTLRKLASWGSSVALSLIVPIARRVVAPLVTTTAVASAAGAVIGGAVVADTVNYVRRNHTLISA